MASSSSSNPNPPATSASNERDNDMLVGHAPPLPSPPPPPPAPHAIYLEQLYRDPPPPPPQPPQIAFLCRGLTWGLLIFLGLSSFSILLWLVFHPTFPQLYVASAALSAVTIASTTATAECNLTLLLTNPNRHLDTLYDRVEVTLIYLPLDARLSVEYPTPFVQRRRSRMFLETSIGFYNMDVGSEVANAMSGDVESGVLSLGVKIVATVRYRNGKWRTRVQFLRAYCGGVTFGFNSSRNPGNFLNPYRECEVYVYTT